MELTVNYQLLKASEYNLFIKNYNSWLYQYIIKRLSNVVRGGGVMKRKKQGASLIVVVILFMFISTVSMAMLSMVAGNYKARVAESKRVENLYASDSGLDVAYNVIGKTFDAATRYGYYKVETLKNGSNMGPNNDMYKDINKDIELLNTDIYNFQHENDNKEEKDKRNQIDIDRDITKARMLIEEDESMKKILCNEEFKRAFKNFVKKTDDVKDNEQIPDKLEKSIEGHRYVSTDSIDKDSIDHIDKFKEETIEFGIENKNKEPPMLEAIVTENPVNNSDEQKGIKILDRHYKDVTFTVYGDRFYDIDVTSTFYTEKVNDKGLNERRLKAMHKMKVPNYEDIYFQNSTGELHQYLATTDRALTIFGNMNANSANNLTVDGEIFVQGSEALSEKVYGKYYGGITLNNSKNVSFVKNVITRGTFNIQDNVGANIAENLYARNIYAGKIENNNDDNSSGSLLNVTNTDQDKGQVIIDNDLALNLKNTTINIKDFYGINDKDDDKAKASSSIIVNGNYSSTNLYITQAAYIMGMAHIATVGDYQTAESGAVKGNYIAYSIPLTDDEKKQYNDSLTVDEKSKYSISLDNTEKFVYHDPLQLLEPDTNDSTITVQQAKENHFLAYWSQKGRIPDAGGIHWPVNSDGSTNVKSIGSIVYNKGNETQVIKSNYNQDLFLENHPIGMKRIEFAKEVYKFGQTANIGDYNNTYKTKVGELIDTGNIPSEYNLGDQQNKGEYAIFNNSSFKEIQIVKATGSEDIISISDDIIKINVPADKNNKYILKAVIATAGKVSIESGITINGCIVAEGDLDINGDDVKINYDIGVIERVQAQSSVTFKTFRAVFGNSIVDDADATTPDNSTNTNSATNYDLKNFLENKSWKILK